MKRIIMMMRGMLVLAFAFALSGSFLTSAQAAGAVTTIRPAVVNNFWTGGTTTSMVLIKGLDGAIWYTLTNVTGANLSAGVNDNNPFVGSPVTFNADGFVNRGNSTNGLSSSTTVIGACNASGQGGNSCIDIWAKVPGVGTFNEGPTAQTGGPISNAANVVNILAVGIDNALYYTLFTGAAGSGNNYGTSGTNIAANDPFGGNVAFGAQVTELSDTGWTSTAAAAAGNLQNRCNNVPRTCFGLWVQMP